MKKMLRICLILMLTGAAIQSYGQRYLSEVFTNVTVTSNVQYAVNISVLTGSPQADTLRMDIYEPAGDTLGERPLILLAHTGSFLPNSPSSPVNGVCTGSRTDSATVEMAKQFARRGYVCALYSYRLGWNPVSSNQDVRTGTLLNAAYRGIQDGRTAVRYFRDNYANAGNAYGIDTSAIVSGGQGTGGYISLAMASLNRYGPELFLTKFQDAGGNPYADTSLSGDYEGKWNRPLNVGNYVNESSEIDFAFNLGGAVGDSMWIEAGEVPMVSFHCPNDPFAPYDFGAVIVPTTGDFVVNVSGSKGAIRNSDSYGNQQPIINLAISDVWTTEANTKNDGLEGLFPFQTPTPESGPWEWWDELTWGAIPHPSGGTFNDVCKQTNPNMSKTKGLAYIDTIMGYLNPRLVGVLNLTATGVEDAVDANTVDLFPNPSESMVNIRTEKVNGAIREVVLYNFSGRMIRRFENVNAMEFTVNHDDLAAGIYVIRVRTDKGDLTKKLIFR